MAEEERRPTDEGATDFMDVKQVAAYLGVEEQVVSELVEQGKMPVIRFGERWRFCRAGLIAWGVEAGFGNLQRRM